jgi:hypothetical protein
MVEIVRSWLITNETLMLSGGISWQTENSMRRHGGIQFRINSGTQLKGT